MAIHPSGMVPNHCFYVRILTTAKIHTNFQIKLFSNNRFLVQIILQLCLLHIYIYMLPSYIYIQYLYILYGIHTQPPHIYTIHLTDISVITVGLIPTRYYFYVQKSIVIKFMLSMNKHHFSLIIFGIPHFLCFLYLLFACFVMFL